LEGVYEKWQNGNRGRKLNGDNIMASYPMTEQTSKNQTGTVARFESANKGY